MADRYYQSDEPLDIFGSDPFGRNYLYGLSGSGDGLGLQPPAQGLPVDTRPYDRMQATPRSFISGLFSDVLGGALNMPDLPKTGVPALDLFYANRRPLMNLMGVGDVQKTAERISYGEPLTTGAGGLGGTSRPLPETVGAALTVAPFVGEATAFGTRVGRAGARMVGERMAENVAMGRPNLPSMFAEPRASLFAVEPSPMMPKPQAPVSELGFYSATEQAALNLPRNKGTGQSFLNDLMKAPDVKKDELAWTGLDDFLKDKPNVTKQEVQDFIANNKVDLQEVQLSGKGEKSAVFTEFNPDKNKFIVYGNDLTIHGSFNTNQEAINFSREYNSKIPYAPSKYDKYQLAGGENYREILLKMPKESPTTNDIATKLFGKEMRFLSEAEKDAVVAEARRIEDTTPKDYISSHFSEPNILAHIRVNDRIDADGKKMLLVEELQSDWHQAGRESGYAPKNAEAQLAASRDRMAERSNEIRRISTRMAELDDSQLDEFNALAQERQRLQDLQGEETEWGNRIYDAKNSGVPDAPFKDTWYQLALKRVMKYAADNGYERVGLTTGKQQASRYDLSKQVDYIDYKTSGYGDNTKYSLGIVDKNQQGIDLPKEYYSAKELPEIVGKEIAEKIIKGEGQSGGGRMTLRGVDLQVGGEGMKKYYDEIYPKFLEKYGKKWDASVGETKIITEDNAWNMAEQIKQRGISDAQWRALSEEDKLKLWNDIKKSVGRKQEPIRYIDITPKMKESVGKGQPLFTAIPAGTLGLGGLEYADPFASPLTEDTTR
jgi:hypothetical protein